MTQPKPTGNRPRRHNTRQHSASPHSSSIMPENHTQQLALRRHPSQARTQHCGPGTVARHTPQPNPPSQGKGCTRPRAWVPLVHPSQTATAACTTRAARSPPSAASARGIPTTSRTRGKTPSPHTPPQTSQHNRPSPCRCQHTRPGRRSSSHEPLATSTHSVCTHARTEAAGPETLGQNASSAVQQPRIGASVACPYVRAGP